MTTEVTAARVVEPPIRDGAARIAAATLAALPRWREVGLRDEALAAIAEVATRLADPTPAGPDPADGETDDPATRTDVYVLAALLMLHPDASSGALATDLVELLA